MAPLAGICPVLHSPVSARVCRLGDLGLWLTWKLWPIWPVHFNLGVCRQLRPCSSSFLGLDHLRPGLPFRSFFGGGSTSLSVVNFGRTLFSIWTKRHWKDTAQVLLSESFPVEAWQPLTLYSVCDLVWVDPDPRYRLTGQWVADCWWCILPQSIGSKGLIVEGWAVFSRQSRQNWSNRP